MRSLSSLSAADQAELVGLLADLSARRTKGIFDHIYPDETVEIGGQVWFSRHLYPRHMEIMQAGAHYRERCFMAANRIGKTLGVGAYEITAHLTGRYPHWWVGKRFGRPVDIWAAGATNETTRDILQYELLGRVRHTDNRRGFTGDRMVPRHLIGTANWKQGVQDLADTVAIEHISGGYSRLGFKSYQQGRKAFEGTSKDGVWLDEEPPLDVYGECLIRTATTNGFALLTFTPLLGLSETVLQFMPQDLRPTEDIPT